MPVSVSLALLATEASAVKPVAVTLTASGAMTNANEYRKVVVAYRNGAPVHLDQVAKVYDTVAEPRSAALLNGKPVVGFDDGLRLTWEYFVNEYFPKKHGKRK